MNATAQLNARMDPELKAAGDAALSLIGLSPTQAVRSLWAKAARRGEDLEQVAKLLAPADDGAAGTGDSADPVAQGWAIVEAAYAELGIRPLPASDSPSDDDMLAEALCERLVEKERSS